MILAVVFLVLGGGAEAEVRADVEHPDTGFHQGNRVFGGQSVREGEKSGIAFRGDLFDVRCGEFQVHSVKTGEDVGDLPARVLAGGDDPQIHIRMPRQKTDQFFAGVAGCADNGHTYLCHIVSPNHRLKKVVSLI